MGVSAIEETSFDCEMHVGFGGIKVLDMVLQNGSVINLKEMTSFRNLKYFELQIFNLQGRNHEFLSMNLGLAIIQYIVLYRHNPVVVINGLVSEIRFTYLWH
jgi:hypothetical protein